MSKLNLKLTEGLLIAGIPIIGYWLAFIYQLGYCSYFNIPTNFIEIGILEICIAVIGLITILGLANLYGTPFYIIFRDLPYVIKSAIIKVGGPVLLIWGYSTVMRLPFKQFLIIAIIVGGILGFLEFFFPLITQRNIKGYKEKLIAQNKLEYEKDSLMDTFANNIGRAKFLLFILFLIISFITFFAGGYEAKTKKKFIVISNPNKAIVLKTYKDNFIAAKYDEQTNRVSTKYMLIPINENNFEIQKLGPVTPLDLE